MSDKKEADNKAIHGLSIVDATTTNDTNCAEDVVREDNLVVTIEDEVNSRLDNDNVAEEVEEKINLFDALDEKEPVKDTLQNSTLIITTEEHLEVTTCEDTLNSSTDTVKNAKAPVTDPVSPDSGCEEPKKPLTKAKSKNEDHSYFWVSNISRHVKATDLKKIFSQMGKVVTAKILTNGKNYFGYVSVESTEAATKCIKQLNNTMFDGKKIVVSKDRPDLRENKVKVEPRKKRSEKLEAKKDNKAAESVVTKEEEKHEPKKSKVTEEEEVKASNIVAEVKKKLEKSKAEIGRYKWKIVEYQRRHEGMRKKCGNLEKELKEVQFNLRAERRKLNQDREQFEKSKKMEQMRLEADKAVINKELGEVKKLREHLKVKIEEIKAQSKKIIPKRRGSRSPIPPERSRSPRGRSPVLRVCSRIGYRPNERNEKKRKRDDPPHSRTPPPPPKLTNGIGKKRGDNLTHRQYFEGAEKRSSPLGYDYRHKSSFPQHQEVSRGPWQAPYSKDPRRANPAPSGGQNYAPDPRYGGGYQFPTSSLAVPPRSYYPEFGKPYGHY